MSQFKEFLLRILTYIFVYRVNKKLRIYTCFQYAVI